MKDKSIKKELEKIATKLDGNFTEYSEDTIIITIPTGESRFQSVKGFIRKKDNGRGEFLTFSSSICRLHEHPEVNFRKMLELNFTLGYAKISITDEDYLEVVSAIDYELCTEGELEYMIEEAAKIADKLELEITGKDIH